MAEAGQNDLFAMEAPEKPAANVDTSVLPKRDAWTDDLRLQGEMETLGLYLTGHPIDQYENDLPSLGVTRLSQIQEMKVSKERGKTERIRVAGRVEAVARRETQRGPMATVLLDDSTASLDIPFFSDALEKNLDYMQTGNMLLIEGGLSYDSYRDSTSVRGDNALTIEEARILHATSMVLRIDHRDTPQVDVEQVMAQLVQQLQPYAGGNCRVILDYTSHSYQGRMVLGEQWQITPRDSLLLQLRQAYGDGAVTLGYHQAHNTSAARTSV
jgi:DNA polymerase-3 subunit alpha